MDAAWHSSLHVMCLKCRKEKTVDQVNEKIKKNALVSLSQSLVCLDSQTQ